MNNMSPSGRGADAWGGFTLIEVTVALTLAVVAAAAVTQILARAERVVDVGRERFVAVNLAREGLELVRAVRDTNWFASGDKSQWLANGLCEQTGTSFLDADRRFTIDPTLVRNLAGVGEAQEAALYIQPNDEWSHQPSGSPTAYERVISIDCSTKADNPAFVSVAATVTWKNRGQERQVIIKEKLYNWIPE